MNASLADRRMSSLPTAALYSSVARMCQIATKLPANLQALYQAHFVEGKDPQQVCEDLGLSLEQFERDRSTMLRNIRAGMGEALAEQAVSTKSPS
jgi:hypothetical protein